MGRRGPSPKPTVLRLLEGNRSKRPINAAEPKPTEGAPAMPSDLDAYARRVWRQTVPELRALGLLTVVDGHSLAAYCRACSQVRACQQVLNVKGLIFKTPSGYIQQRPEISIQHKAMQLIKAFAGEFGLSPASRTRLATQPDDDADPFAFLDEVTPDLGIGG